MPIRILIPTPLRPFTGQQASIEVDGQSVDDLLGALTAQHSDLRPHLFREDGRLRSFVNIYVNDEDIRQLGGISARVQPGDTISIVPSVAGGSPATATDALPALTNDEIARYSRHLIVPEVGLEGQRKLKAARVLCVGAGGLGSPAALYLTAAGVGTLGLVDFDVVDVSNLQRQVLYSTDQVGQRKLAAAAFRLTGLNPEVRVVQHETPLTSANALDIVKDYDLVVDGADNFPTRYLVNDACVLLGKPNVYGSIFRFDGQASVFAVKGGPCYRCLYPEPPPPGLVPSCAEGGVLGVLPGLVGTVQATEAIKLILGQGESLVGRLLLIDALDMQFRTLKLRRDPDCAICGDHPTIAKLIDYEQFCGVPARGAAPAAGLPPEFETTVDELKARLDSGEPTWILDVREPNEFAIARIPDSTLIPLGDLAKRLAEIPQGPDAPEIVVHCKMGGRSAKAVALLRDHGFTRIRNLKGGILAWADRIDSRVPKY
ncbi:MAG TPA: molybdopterin-synthase adenylyltransferase MoeB [Vicinamibacterales bacterium]|nr:molybdopterin-synthase adenylyltransferase MoeB [Vicinamibacterales bacterium]